MKNNKVSEITYFILSYNGINLSNLRQLKMEYDLNNLWWRKYIVMVYTYKLKRCMNELKHNKMIGHRNFENIQIKSAYSVKA